MKIFSAQLKGTTIVVEGATASLTGSFTGSIAGIDINSTNTFTASTIARLNSIETISSSNDGRVGNIELFTSSTSARLNSIETISASNINRIGSLEIVSASNISRISSLETTSASVDTLNTTQNIRLNSLEIKTGSLATTGSNTFIGTQTITGSLFISANLVVQGTSSLQNITASAVSIGTNIVNLNTANPAIRYAGLVIGDSGSVGGSGSFLYDSVQDEMIFVHRGTSTVVTSSVTLMGPQTFDNVGNETYPTANYIQKGTGNEHLVDSCIFDNGSNVGIGNISPVSTCLTGTLTLYKSHNGDIASVPSTTAQTYYGNQSSLYLFGRNSGVSIISANSEEGAIKFGNAAVSNYATIATSTGTSSIGGDMYFRVGTDTERVRIFNTGITCFSCQICTPHLIASNNISIGSSCTSTDGYNTRLRITNIQNDTFVFAFNNQACKPIMYMYGGNINNPQGYTAWVDNTSGQTNHQISHNTAEATYFAAKGGFVSIGKSTPCTILNIHCVSNGGDSLYTNMFSITTDVSNVYNHLAFSPTSIEYRRETSTGVDFCIRTLVCNGSSGGNIIFAPNLVDTSVCSFPRMKIQQNGFVGIGAMCAQTYLHICDNLSAGRDDLIRLQTNISTNHVWLKSISCGGVTSIFGSTRANTDGNIRANTALAGTTSNHDFDIFTNGVRRMTINNSGGVSFIGNSQDYPYVSLCGPTYTMIAMGDRSSSSLTDVGFISIFNQGARVIDLPGNSDAITFNNGAPLIAGRAYASGDAAFGYQFLEVCNGAMYHGPLSLGNSGGGVALTPLYSGGGKRWAFGWNTAEMNSMTNYNNCTPILINWGINGDNPTTDRKFCFNYNGQAYSTSGTWGTLSSNCIIKENITGASSQWNDIKNICIVNYKMKEEVEEFGSSARLHLGVIAEQIAQISPGLLEEGGYSQKWCTCLNGVKTSILHMKAVKALQEAMCRIEVLESCLGLS